MALSSVVDTSLSIKYTVKADPNIAYSHIRLFLLITKKTTLITIASNALNICRYDAIATGDASLIEQINREGYEQFKEQM